MAHMKTMAGVVATALLALVLSVAPMAAQTSPQTWPQRPVKFILTLGAGSGADIGARLIAEKLTARWGQPVVVENRPGGDGIVAINAFVSAHDDHVLLLSPSSAFIAHPYMYFSQLTPSEGGTLIEITVELMRATGERSRGS